MDTFVDSTWYYFRYIDPRNEEMPFSPEKAAYWTPVDQYIGGVDHAVMHLLYTRFWTKVMRDIGLIDFNEPVKRLLTQGMVTGEVFFDDETGKRVYFPPDSINIERDQKGKITGAMSAEGKSLKYAVERMSKSKGNGIDPDEMIQIYGADAARLYVLFSAPVENELVWNDAGIEGASRFIQRVYRFVWRWHEALKRAPQQEPSEFSPQAKKLRQKTHQTIKRVADDFERLQLNTPVAALMELSNELGDFKIEPSAATESDLFAINEAVKSLILMLTPYAPHSAEEMWAVVSGSDAGILRSDARFPEYREELARKDEIEIPVQVNGKLRSRVMAAPDTSKEELETMALADQKTREFIAGKEIVKVVVVPNRLVNIVIK
jgi:leucyl-tRNA synthetase